MKDKNTAGELSYFIFDLDKHAHFIDDFLQKASEAHNDQIKSPAVKENCRCGKYNH